MERKYVILSALAAFAVLSLLIASPSGDSDAAGDTAITLYAEVGGENVRMSGSGPTLATAMNSALKTKGYTADFGAVNINSFNGTPAPAGKAWTVQQWQPPVGWKIVTLNNYTSTFVAGTSYSICLSDMTTGTDGKTVYSAPSFEPMATAYFFIKFKEDFDANDGINSILTLEKRKAGFWIPGTGSNLAWAFSDACGKCGFELNMSDGVKNGVTDLDYVGWLYSFVGLTDVAVSSSLWKYWSQFYWDGQTGSWVFSQTMGHYDPGVTKYFALVRQTTTENNVSTNIGADPSGIPQAVRSGQCSVKYVDGDGRTVKNDAVPYFGTSHPPATAAKSPSGGKGYRFSGWDAALPITQVVSDMTVNALFNEFDMPAVPVTSVKISGPDKIQAGSSARYSAAILPADATNQTVTWGTSDASLATVDGGGNVRALKSGSVTITATSFEGRVDSMSVEITKVTDRIALSDSSCVLAVGEVHNITVSVGPDDITWASSDDRVIKVSGGSVNAVAPGTATVTASSGAVRATCQFAVSAGVAEVTVDCNGADGGPAISSKTLMGATSGLKLSTSDASVVVPASVAVMLSGSGKPLKFSVRSIDAEALSEAQRGKVGESLVLSFDAMVGADRVHDLGGKVKVTVPYQLKQGQKADGVKVFYLDGDELTEVACTYQSGSIVFETDHFSYYAISYSAPPSAFAGGEMLIVAAIAAIAAIAAGIGIWAMRSKKKAA